MALLAELLLIPCLALAAASGAAEVPDPELLEFLGEWREDAQTWKEFSRLLAETDETGKAPDEVEEVENPGRGR